MQVPILTKSSKLFSSRKFRVLITGHLQTGHSLLHLLMLVLMQSRQNLWNRIYFMLSQDCMLNILRQDQNKERKYVPVSTFRNSLRLTNDIKTNTALKMSLERIYCISDSLCNRDNINTCSGLRSVMAHRYDILSCCTTSSSSR